MKSEVVLDPVVGTTVDRYRIVKAIGEGASGRVYEAVHTAFGKRVALKLMRESLRNEADLFARFQREAESATKIRDPHIIEVFDLGMSANGNIYVVMELLEGRSLAKAMAAEPFDEKRTVHVIRQVLAGISAAHAVGIVHRDLKPENVFLVERAGDPDFVKILDFGVCKLAEPDATKLTATGALLGTPAYMSPEQVNGEELDHRTDIWAVGVILYELLAGRLPFTEDKLLSLLKSIGQAQVPRLSRVAPTVSPRLSAAVHEALQKRREDRYESAEAFAMALVEPVTPKRATTERPVAGDGPPPAPSKLPYLLAAGGLVLGGVAGALVARATTPAPAANVEPQPAPGSSTTTAVEPPSPSLEISSQPDGAEVWLDGKLAGVTPLAIPRVAPARHQLRLVHLGYLPLERAALVRPSDGQVRLEYNLEPSSQVSVAATVRPASEALATALAGKVAQPKVREAIVACWELASAATRVPVVLAGAALVPGKRGCNDEGCWNGPMEVEWGQAPTAPGRATAACLRDAIGASLRELPPVAARTDVVLRVGPAQPRPERDKLAVTVTTPGLPAKLAAEYKLDVDRGALLGCWDAWYAATGDPQLVVELPLAVLAGENDEGNAYLYPKFDAPPGAAAACVKKVLDPLVQKAKVTEAFTAKVVVAIQ